MSLQEFVAHEIETLEESELRAVTSTISFHPFRARTSLDEARLTSLYREFEGEDRELAEAGVTNYAEALAREDSQ